MSNEFREKERKEGGTEREEEEGERKEDSGERKMSTQLKNLAQQVALYVFNSDPTCGVLDDF